MTRLDYEQQQDEEQRMMDLLSVLQKVSRGLSTEQDAMYLASELGLTTIYEKEQSNG